MACATVPPEPTLVEDVFHIQNVNAYDSRLKTWLRRFNGVASKYLDHYLSWRRLLERYRETISPAICLNEAAGLGGSTANQQLIQTAHKKSRLPPAFLLQNHLNAKPSLTILGVIKTSNSVLSSIHSRFLNNHPRYGRSPKKGTR